jgi:hypothetical protein
MSKEKVLFIYGLWVIAQMVKRHGGDWIGSNFKSLSLSLSLSLSPIPKEKDKKKKKKEKKRRVFYRSMIDGLVYA